MNYTYYKPFLKKLTPLLISEGYKETSIMFVKEWNSPHGIFTMRISVLPYSIENRNPKKFLSILKYIEKELKLAIDENGKLLSIGRVPEGKAIIIEVFQKKVALALEWGGEFHVGKEFKKPIRFIYDEDQRIWEIERWRKSNEMYYYRPAKNLLKSIAELKNYE